MFKCDIYDLAAVKQLESLPSHVGVYQLLSIMLAGDLTALAAFVKEHASVLSDCGITAEDATMKTRCGSCACAWLRALDISLHLPPTPDRLSCCGTG